MTSTTFSDSHPSPSPTTAFSPFSTPHSHATDFATSDESPDLGAFRNIFRTFQELQPRWPAHLAPTALVPGAPSTLLGLGTGTPPTTDRDARGLTPTDLDSSLDLDGVELHSTVWAQQPVARYLDAASPPPGSATPSSTTNSQSQGQGRDYSRPRSALVTHDLPTHDLPRPTLGGLDAAFEFLANERARLAAQRASLPSIRPLPLPIPITFESSLEPEPGRSSNNTNTTSTNNNNNASSNRRRRRRKASSLVRIGGGRVRGHDADFEDAEDSWEEPLSPLEGMGGGGGHGSLPVTPAKRLAATADTTAVGLLAVAASQSQSKSKSKSSPLTAKDKGKDKVLAQDSGTGKNLPSGSAADYAHRLHHARSTPVLRAPTLQTRPLDPQRVRLRALAIKLKFLFPGEAGRLTRVLAQPSMGAEPEIGVGAGGEGVEEEEDFADVRGPEPVVGEGEAITHVFVDYSNILIGYLSYLRSHRLQAAHLSHAALALVLERGRPITRRVLAASSPLYQPLDPAQKLGYEVHVYARVPDTGDGADRIRKNGMGGESPRNGKVGVGGVESPRNGKVGAGESPRKAEPERGRKNAHRRGVSVGSGVIQESDSSASAGAAKLAPGKTVPIAIPQTANANSNPPSSTGSPSNARIRYREQGVDELLQLKLHQAIAAQGDSAPPPGSTIVLATGDGNAGQFNEDGFRGCVRLALRRKWRVELHAWETGTSRAWAREFGRETGFSIEKMDRFATDLIVA